MYVTVKVYISTMKMSHKTHFGINICRKYDFLKKKLQKNWKKKHFFGRKRFWTAYKTQVWVKIAKIAWKSSLKQLFRKAFLIFLIEDFLNLILNILTKKCQKSGVVFWQNLLFWHFLVKGFKIKALIKKWENAS